MNNSKENIFSNLAYWQYVLLSNKRKIDINSFQVSTEIANILKKLNLTDNDADADKWAENFLDYAQKRSLYFDNNFTHKTFLEYYTAYYIFKYHFIKGEIPKTISLINKYIENPFWEIVLELLMNMMDEYQGDNDVIDKILNKIMLTKKNSTLFILRILPSLKHVSINLVKDIIVKEIEAIIKDPNKNREIFNRLKRLLYSGKFSESFQMGFDEVYYRLNEDQERINYFSFCYEINSSVINTLNYRARSFRNVIPKLMNKYIQEQQCYHKLSPFLSIMHSASSETDFIQDAIEFIHDFGIEGFWYRTFAPVYSVRPITTYCSFFTSVLFLPQYITSLPRNLDVLRDYGITPRALIVYISRNRKRYRSFSQKESIYAAIDLFARTEDKDILLILFFWLNSFAIKFEDDGEQQLAITEYARAVLSESPYLDLILSTFGQAEVRELACSTFGSSYKEIRKELANFRKRVKEYKDEAS